MGTVLWRKLQTAHHWNKKPSELGICRPEDDLDFMMAYTTTRIHMDAWEDSERKRNADVDKAFRELTK